MHPGCHGLSTSSSLTTCQEYKFTSDRRRDVIGQLLVHWHICDAFCVRMLYTYHCSSTVGGITLSVPSACTLRVMRVHAEGDAQWDIFTRHMCDQRYTCIRANARKSPASAQGVHGRDCRSEILASLDRYRRTATHVLAGSRESDRPHACAVHE